MAEESTDLLKRCNAGAKMAIGTIERVYPFVTDKMLKDALSEYIKKHEDVVARTREQLADYCEGGADPNPIAQMMAKITTKIRLKRDCSDGNIAVIVIEGCNMGTKKLREYKKKYGGASAESCATLQSLMELEGKLMNEMQSYL